MKLVHEEFNHFGVQQTYNTSGKGCNYKFNNLFFSVWCVIEFMHHSMHLHFDYNLC